MIKIPEYVQFVIDALIARGHAAYIVGGSVRDALRGLPPDDFDVTTDAEPKQVCDVFEGRCKVILTGVQHGTVTVLSDKKPVEVTTYRTDGDYIDNRHPQNVTFVKNLACDLARRDFTVNAMAYSPREGLIDLYGGQADLENRILRCVGKADLRFHEDALRMLRALRFAAVLVFDIEKETAAAIHKNRALLCNVSAERIRVELFKLLCGADAQKILLSYNDVFFTIFSMLDGLYTKEDYKAAVQAACTTEADAVLRFAAILLPIASKHPDACFKAIDSLKTDKKSADKIKFAVVHATEMLATDETAVKHVLNKHGTEHLMFLAKLKNAHETLRTMENVLQSGAPYRICDLAVSGDAVAALGYKGKEIGKVLQDILTLVIEGKIQNTKEDIIKQIKGLSR